MKKFFLILLLIPFVLFGISNQQESYAKGRIKDSKKHFKMIVSQMRSEQLITYRSSSQALKAFSRSVDKKEGQREYFHNKIDQMLEKNYITESCAQLLKDSWKNSAGYIFLQNPIIHDPLSWLKNSQGVKSERSLRASIYEQTKTAAMNGYKTADQTLHSLSTESMIKIQEGTQVFKTVNPIPETGPYPETLIKVYEEDTIALTRQLQLEGYNPVALNFANRKSVGGGVVRGAKAQEEDLFRRSNYFLGLDIKYNPILSEELNGKYRIPKLGAIYTPHVQVIREPAKKGYAFIEPFEVDFIASAAFNLNPSGFDAPLTEEAYLEQTAEKIRNILRISIITGHDTVVLGAFGCGAFNNDPKVIATLFDQVIHEYEFTGHFRLIAFGILDDARGINLRTFKEILQ